MNAERVWRCGLCGHPHDSRECADACCADDPYLSVLEQNEARAAAAEAERIGRSQLSCGELKRARLGY